MNGDQGFLVAAAAANLAGWHDAHLRALGFRTEWRDGFWVTPDVVPHIFFRAIAVRPGAATQVLADRIPAHQRASLSDPWSDLAVSGLGFALDGDHDWMVRRVEGPAGQRPAANAQRPAANAQRPAGLVIERVRDADALADFEWTAARGFGSQPVPPHTWHAPPLLLDERLQVWRGRVEDTTVAVAMGFAEAGVLGIYGVTTVAGARQQGFGTALTSHAIEAGPRLPVVLQPSSMAEAMYRRLGFERFTTFRAWDRAATDPRP